MKLIIYFFLIVILNVTISFCSVSKDISDLFKYLQIEIPANNDVACKMNGIICSYDKKFITHLNIGNFSSSREIKQKPKQTTTTKTINHTNSVPKSLNEAKRVTEKITKTLNVTTKTEKSAEVTKTKEKEPTLIPKENLSQHPHPNPDEDKNSAEVPDDVEDENDDNDDDKDDKDDNDDNDNHYDKEKDIDNDNDNDKKIENMKKIKMNSKFEQKVIYKFKRTERNGNTININNLFNKNYSLDRTPLSPKNEWLEVSEPFDLSTFPILSNLISLKINSSSNIKTIPPRIFELPNLQYLHFADTSLNGITKDVNPKSLIKIIYIEGNSNAFNEFPTQFSKLPNLTELYLENNNFNCILPEELLNFKSLQVLSIPSNHMTGEVVIPDSLKYLNIGNNQFTSLKANTNVNNLEVFIGNNNKFESNIFNNLSIYDKLMLIDLSYNSGITSISESISYLKELQVLNLKNDDLTELPPNIYKLSKLKGLDISGNPNLNVKLINFDKSTVEQCVLSGIKIECYQPNTCASIDDNFSVRNCTDTEINEILNAQTVVDKEFVIDNIKTDSTESSHIVLFLSGVAAILLIIVLTLAILVYRGKKYSNSSNSSGSDNISYMTTPSIKSPTNPTLIINPNLPSSVQSPPNSATVITPTTPPPIPPSIQSPTNPIITITPSTPPTTPPVPHVQDTPSPLYDSNE